MRKPVSPTEAMATLTKGETNASQEIQKEIDFCLKHQAELRTILYGCQEVAKATTKLMMATGKLSLTDLATTRKDIENRLFSKAFDEAF